MSSVQALSDGKLTAADAGDIAVGTGMGTAAAYADDLLAPRLGGIRAGGVVDGVLSAGTSVYSNAGAYERGEISAAVPAERRSDIGRTLHRINLKLALLGFTFDGLAGHVAFRIQAMLHGSEGLLPGMIGLMTRTATDTASAHLPELRAIAES